MRPARYAASRIWNSTGTCLCNRRERLDLIYRSSSGLSGYCGLGNRALGDITMYCNDSYRENIGEYK